MATIHTALLALAALTTPFTTALHLPRSPGTKPKTTPVLPLDEISNTGPTPLPTPSQAPKYIVLGLGFQNYTCCPTTSTWVQTAPGAGAVATLYDLTSILTSSDSSSLSSHSHSDSYCKPALQAFEACLLRTKCSPSTSNHYCRKCHPKHNDNNNNDNNNNNSSSSSSTSSSTSPLPTLTKIGTHSFSLNTSTSTPHPTFSLPTHNIFLSARKAGSAPAPATAYRGVRGGGAVDWVFLVEDGTGQEGAAGEVGSVFRVGTAGGGVLGGCEVAGEGEGIQVPYATEYWFF